MHCHVHFSRIIFFYEDSKNVSDAEREDVIEMLTNNSTFICWNLISFDFFCLEMKKKSFKKTFMTCIVKADVGCVRYEKSLSNKFDFEGEDIFLCLLHTPFS